MIFISGFYDLSKHEPRRTSLDSWIERSEWLLSQDVGIRLFAQPSLLSRLHVDVDFTVIDPEVKFDPDELVLADAALSRSRIGFNRDKDTARYLCLMRGRFEWMRCAAAWAIGDEALTWVDFGLPHAGEDSLKRVAARDPAPGRIRIAVISHVPLHARADLDVYYSRHWWPVGGGLWSARRPEIEWLADQIANEWRRCLALGFAVTDEMMLGRILIEHPEKFDIYYADHTSLAANWCGVRRSHRLIAECALRALEDGSPSEAKDRFLALAEGDGG